ncbi:MAG: Na/Pi cotransporter family protein [Firmicutes bacterium]|nr:Na/Pi cotransporter family protein [Bacillota bacterium]
MAAYLPLIFGTIGGLGLFLYGMQLMADGLQKIAGDRLRRILEILTSTPIIGVLVGAFVTMLIQSSSATTVMVVGFVNAGLLTLKQAVSLIMGANIGTTVTAFMVSLKLTDLALPAVGIGFLISLLSKKKSTRYMGEAILGFGLLFLGMKVMGDAMQPLKDNAAFANGVLSLSKSPLLGMLAGLVLTAIIQSSSAVTGLVVTLAAEGLIDLNVGLAVTLGSNIGTCVTALLASIGTQLVAKRAAVAHLLFNVTGVIIFMIFFRPFAALVATTHPLLERQVANAHIIFNATNTLLLLPLINQFTRLVENLTPGEVSIEHMGPLYLDENLMKTPSVALGQASRELVRMGKLALEMLEEAHTAFTTSNADGLESVFKKEETINRLEHAVVDYLATLSQQSLSTEQSDRLAALLSMSSDIERVGDLSENIAELAEYRAEHRLPFSEEAINELDAMYQTVHDLGVKTLYLLESGDIRQANDLLAQESEVDKMEKSLRLRHINRLNSGTCFPASGIIFLDLISNLERIADHAANIVEAVAHIDSDESTGE